MGFATAAVEALLEQADFGFEFGDALVEFAVALLQAGGAVGLAGGELGLELLQLGGEVGLALGEELFEGGFAKGSAVVEGFVVAGLLAGLGEGLLAGRQGAGGLDAGQVGGAGFHKGEYAKLAGRRGGW
jgi:hypothetical protein